MNKIHTNRTLQNVFCRRRRRRRCNRLLSLLCFHQLLGPDSGIKFLFSSIKPTVCHVMFISNANFLLSLLLSVYSFFLRWKFSCSRIYKLCTVLITLTFQLLYSCDSLYVSALEQNTALFTHFINYPQLLKRFNSLRQLLIQFVCVFFFLFVCLLKREREEKKLSNSSSMNASVGFFYHLYSLYSQGLQPI